MKFTKTLAVGALALALASVASATNVKITGSTAIRKAVYAGIVRTLAAGGHNVRAISADPNFNNKTVDGAQQATFVNDAGDSVQACLSGSVGGVGYVIGGDNVSTAIATNGGDVNRAWLTVVPYGNTAASLKWVNVVVDAAGNFTYTSTGSTVSNNGALGNLVVTTESALPAFGQANTPFDAPATASVTSSDSFQNSTIFNSVDFGVTLTDINIGTVSFTFAKGAQHPSVTATQYGHLTNINSQNFQALVNKGFIDLSQITGIAGDAGIDVVLVGRNSDSGTRLGVFAETGVGPVTTGAKQYIPLDASNVDVSISTAGNITHFQQVASDQDGYDSGAFVKATLTKAISAGAVSPGGHPFIQVSYVSAGDTAGTELAFNGALLTQTNVIEGAYTLWTTEHVLYDPAFITGAAQTIVTNIAANTIATNSNTRYANVGGLHVARTAAEGSTVLHN